MKISPAFPFSAFVLVALALPGWSQTTVPLAANPAAPATPASALARPRPDPAANASAALSNGGNPAAAIGAAHAASRAALNQSAAITGGAATVGANGERGNALAASSVNGVDTLGTPDSESIGMRRARLRAAGAADSVGLTAAGGRASGAAPVALSAASLRTSTAADRPQLLAQLEQQVRSTAPQLASAEARVGGAAAADSTALARALAAARAAESRLTERLQSARRASALEWNDVRTVLAADYEAYQRAVGEVQRFTRRAE